MEVVADHGVPAAVQVRRMFWLGYSVCGWRGVVRATVEASPGRIAEFSVGDLARRCVVGRLAIPPPTETFAKLHPALPRQAGILRPLDAPHGFPPARE